MQSILLASSSLRRKALLERLKITFTQISPPFDEEKVPFEGNPSHYVETIARGKGEAVLALFPGELILSADTTVYCEGKIYNKPSNFLEAKKFYDELCGRTHEVWTAISIRNKNLSITKSQTTAVTLRALTKEQIEILLQRFPFSDKAGGYAIQECGSLLVASITGCYDNIVGLPLGLLADLLQEFEVDIWKYV